MVKQEEEKGYTNSCQSLGGDADPLRRLVCIDSGHNVSCSLSAADDLRVE